MKSFLVSKTRTSYAHWTYGLLEVQIKSLGTHLRLFLHDTPRNWSFQVHLFAYTHDNQALHFQSSGIIFHTQPCISLEFQINLSRKMFRQCAAQKGSDKPPHSLYQSSGLNILLHRVLLIHFSTRFLSWYTAMLRNFLNTCW